MYFEVAVSAAKDRAHDTFTYFSNKSLRPGTLVIVPFGNQTSQGIVWNQSETTILKQILPILRVVLPEPIITPYQFKLFRWLAHYYQTSISSIMATVLPTFPSKLVWAQRANLHPKQTLLVAPTVHRLQQIAQALEARNRSFVSYHSDQKHAQRTQVYQAVLQGESPFILATRIGLFLPFRTLAKIYFYDEHDWSYKEQHMPQFHSFTVAKALSQISHAKLVVIDATPRIQTYWQEKHEKTFVIKQPPLSITANQIVIIDLANESKRGNLSIISEDLQQAIYSSLAKRKSILLYLNKKKDGGMLYCKQCQTSTYIATAITNTSLPCPQCKSLNTKVAILNVKTVARDVHKLLGEFGITKGLWQVGLAGSVLQFVIPKKTDAPHQQTKTASGVALITIATQKIFYQAKPKSFGLVAIILADTWLNAPEFRATETAFAAITDIATLVNPQGNVIIQTRQPDHPVLTSFQRRSYQTYADLELTDRQSFGYPPFTCLALLTFKAKTKQTAQKNANALYELLDEKKRQPLTSPPVIPDLIGDPSLTNVEVRKDSRLSGNDGSRYVELIGPFAPLHNETEARILLKAKNHATLTPFLQIVPKNWRINIDPEKIVT